MAFGEKNFVGCEFRIDPRAERMMVKLQMNYGENRSLLHSFRSTLLTESLNKNYSDIDRIIHANLREMGSILHKPTYDRSTCRNTTVVFASYILKKSNFSTLNTRSGLFSLFSLK